jgi:hypothetical protein
MSKSNGHTLVCDCNQCILLLERNPLDGSPEDLLAENNRLKDELENEKLQRRIDAIQMDMLNMLNLKKQADDLISERNELQSLVDCATEFRFPNADLCLRSGVWILVDKDCRREVYKKDQLAEAIKDARSRPSAEEYRAIRAAEEKAR